MALTRRAVRHASIADWVPSLWRASPWLAASSIRKRTRVRPKGRRTGATATWPSDDAAICSPPSREAASPPANSLRLPHRGPRGRPAAWARRPVRCLPPDQRQWRPRGSPRHWPVRRRYAGEPLPMVRRFLLPPRPFPSPAGLGSPRGWMGVATAGSQRARPGRCSSHPVPSRGSYRLRLGRRGRQGLEG